MNKVFNKIRECAIRCASLRKNVQGTALLTALLVMGVLVSISLALSALIIRETGSVKELYEAGGAYYAAESGVEEALYYLDENLPGWGVESQARVLGERADFEYTVKNKCTAYPCFDSDEYNFDDIDPFYFYDVLDLNETITIPLFTVVDGDIVPVEDFAVEFFMNFNPKTDLKGTSFRISGWDVLRWKLFGMRDAADGSGFHTESLHDFTAVSAVQNVNTGEEVVSNAERPSWFGTKACNDFSDRFKSGIVCEDYESAAISGNEDDMNRMICFNTEARDYYLYKGGTFVAKQSCYSIKDFLLRQATYGTGLNYLTLTNMMNPEMLADDISDKIEASRIYFRIETSGEIPREYADVVSDGYSGDAKQSIQVKIKKDSYMPVFNFSLYSTYKDAEYLELTKYVE